MKLSEAIRLGAMWTKQGVQTESMLSSIAPCALGAALLAIGKQKATPESPHGYKTVTDTWPWLKTKMRDPVGGMEATAMEIIWLLNDGFHWTRERIADWVATVEPQETLRDPLPMPQPMPLPKPFEPVPVSA